MNECIFCQIIDGKIPCYKVYEDESFIAFLDIFPRVKGHALLIPKKHHRWVNDVPEFGTYWSVAKEVGLNLQKKLKSSYITYLTMGNEVPHAHIHILPQSNDIISGFKLDPVVETKKEDMQILANILAGK